MAWHRCLGAYARTVTRTDSQGLYGREAGRCHQEFGGIDAQREDPSVRDSDAGWALEVESVDLWSKCEWRLAANIGRGE